MIILLALTLGLLGNNSKATSAFELILWATIYIEIITYNLTLALLNQIHLKHHFYQKCKCNVHIKFFL